MATSGNLAAWLLDGALAAGAGSRVALRQGDRAWTFDRLHGEVARFAAALHGLHVQRGERVAIFMRDSLEAAAAILGAIHAGAIAVPINELATADDLHAYIEHAGAVMVVTDPTHEAQLGAIRDQSPQLREVICVGATVLSSHDYAALIAAAQPVAPAPSGADDIALLVYSAGSDPDELSAVPHCQRTVEATRDSFANQLLALGPSDRVLSVARLSTAYGLGAGLLLPLQVQAESLMFPAQPHSEPLFAAIAAFAPTVLFATPSVYAQLAHDVEATALAHRPLATLRCAVAGAEGMPEQLIPRIRTALGTEVVVGYGLTEIFQFALASRSDDPGARPGGCGKPLAGIQVRLVDDDGDAVGVDEIGTLELQSRSLFSGYWGDKSALGPDGWFTTQDRFMIDRHGYYHHCGRTDDRFKVGGKWVSPAEVERVLTAHEAVWECAVIGAADDEGLVKPLAFVVTNVGQKPGAALEAELRAYVKTTLAPYKYPRWIEFVDSLPRGPGGKLLRYKLRPTGRRQAETGKA